MLKKLAFLAILVVVLAAAYGAAASLGVKGATIQYGIDQDLRCDPDGVTVSGWGLETDDNTVRYVTIVGISADCAGNEMFVRILGENDAPLYTGSGVVIGTTGKQTISFPAPFLNPESIGQLKIWIEGPNP